FEIQPVLWQQPDEAEFGRPQWMFGWTTWACVDERRIVAAYAHRARWSLGLVDTETGTLTDIATDLEPLESVAANVTHALYVGASAADCHQPRRANNANESGPRSPGAVLDQPRLCGRRCQLRRQHGVRPRVSPAPQLAVGHCRCRRQHQRRTVPRRAGGSRSR